jgi:hypothetical protein
MKNYNKEKYVYLDNNVLNKLQNTRQMSDYFKI